MKQKIEPLNELDIARLEALRKWVKGHYDPGAIHQYDTVDGKLNLLNVIVRAKWIELHETAKLQALGAALGDALVQELGMEWIAVDDEHGRDPAVGFPGTSIIAFPLTTISKRIEKGDNVDIYYIFNSLCSKLKELREQAAGDSMKKL